MSRTRPFGWLSRSAPMSWPGRRCSTGRSARRLPGEEQQQAADGVADHEDEHRQLAGDRAPTREEPYRAVVRGDNADDVAEDDRRDLYRGKRGGSEREADAAMRRPEQVPASDQRI